MRRGREGGYWETLFSEETQVLEELGKRFAQYGSETLESQSKASQFLLLAKVH